MTNRANGWTGGQYSAYRMVFGAYLLVHHLALLPYAAEIFSHEGVLPDGHASPLLALFPNIFLLSDAPATAAGLVGLAAIASLLFAVGLADRVAAIVLWYVLACLFGRNPLIANPSLAFVGLLLVVHALLPRAPFGAWRARGRTDPRGGFEVPAPYFHLVWVLMAIGYSYSGLVKLGSPSWLDGTALREVLENPLARANGLRSLLLTLPTPLLQAATWGALALEIGFAPLAGVRRLRPFLWTAMVLMHLGLVSLVDFADLSVGMLMLHAFTFDPAWIRPAHRGARVFYDGACGACHGFVRFILAEDRAGGFTFAALQSTAFVAAVPEGQRTSLPDSIVVVATQGRILVRSDAALYILDGLGGLWRVAGLGLRLVPRPLRDGAYDAVARLRRRLAGSPPDLCPLLPPDLRARFE